MRRCLPSFDCSVALQFLTEAIGQDVCSLRRHTGYMCTVGCKGEEVFWYGKSCGGAGMDECPPLIASPTASPTMTKTPRPPIQVPKVRGGKAGHLDEIQKIRKGLLSAPKLFVNQCYS